MSKENMNYPNYYVLREGYELQDLQDDVFSKNNFSGSMAANHAQIGQYWVRCGVKDSSLDGIIDDNTKIITFATENIKKCKRIKEKQLEEELRRKGIPIYPDEYVDDSLHDED